MSEMTYERCEIRPGFTLTRYDRINFDSHLPGLIHFTPDEQKRLGEWLLMDPPPEPPKIGDPVRWIGWEWQVIGFHGEQVWMVRYEGVVVVYRSAHTRDVEVIR